MKTDFTGTELNLALNFMKQIPFNNHIGLEIHEFTADKAVFKVSMRDELVGNWLQGILHGGVIASALDVAGGTAALVGAYARQEDLPKEERAKNLQKLGTIDIRVDYLRPGKGKEFLPQPVFYESAQKSLLLEWNLKTKKMT